MPYNIDTKMVAPSVLRAWCADGSAVLGSGPRGVTIDGKRWELYGFTPSGSLRLVRRTWADDAPDADEETRTVWHYGGAPAREDRMTADDMRAMPDWDL